MPKPLEIVQRDAPKRRHPRRANPGALIGRSVWAAATTFYAKPEERQRDSHGAGETGVTDRDHAVTTAPALPELNFQGGQQASTH
jgi:hypothetical protein